MEIKKDFKIDVRKTVEKAVAGNDDFHFYVDELTSNEYMPTYAGVADEKYELDEMDEGFFEFLARKIDGDGIYVRLVNAAGSVSMGEAVFDLEYGKSSEKFRTKDTENVLVFEFADFGVKIKGDEVTFGATIDGGCGQTPYFAKFGSTKANEAFISLENPLNKRILEIMEEMIYDN